MRGCPLHPRRIKGRFLQENIFSVEVVGSYYEPMTFEQAEILIERLEGVLYLGARFEGYAVFGVVVVLFYFSYKFLRLFF